MGHFQLSLKIPLDKVSEELLLAAAIKLFELGRLSSEAAAELANLPKPLFLMRLVDYEVDTFTLFESDLIGQMSLVEEDR